MQNPARPRSPGKKVDPLFGTPAHGQTCVNFWDLHCLLWFWLFWLFWSNMVQQSKKDAKSFKDRATSFFLWETRTAEGQQHLVERKTQNMKAKQLETPGEKKEKNNTKPWTHQRKEFKPLSGKKKRTTNPDGFCETKKRKKPDGRWALQEAAESYIHRIGRTGRAGKAVGFGWGEKEKR